MSVSTVSLQNVDIVCLKSVVLTRNSYGDTMTYTVNLKAGLMTRTITRVRYVKSNRVGMRSCYYVRSSLDEIKKSKYIDAIDDIQHSFTVVRG